MKMSRRARYCALNLTTLIIWLAIGLWRDFAWRHPILLSVWVAGIVLHLISITGILLSRMENLWTITRREIGSLFLSPIAWVVMAAFLVAFGAIFSATLGYASMAPTFGILPLIMAFAIPMLTMRQIAEERRSGTIELLTTAPVTDVELVLGKFFGALVFFAFILLPTLVYVWVLFEFSSTGPDKWMLAAGYLGALLTGAFMLSFGLFVSSITREQIVAAVVGALTLFLLMLLGYMLPPNPPVSLGEEGFWSLLQQGLYGVGSFVALVRHLEPFGRGIVDSREVVFFVSFTAFFLFLAVATVGTRKWR